LPFSRRQTTRKHDTPACFYALHLSGHSRSATAIPLNRYVHHVVYTQLSNCQHSPASVCKGLRIRHHSVACQAAVSQCRLPAIPLNDWNGLAVTAVAVTLSLKPGGGGIAFLAFRDLDRDPMTYICEPELTILKMYPHAKMNFLGQGFRQLSYYRQTRATENTHYAAFPGGAKMKIFLQWSTCQRLAPLTVCQRYSFLVSLITFIYCLLGTISGQWDWRVLALSSVSVIPQRTGWHHRVTEHIERSYHSFSDLISPDILRDFNVRWAESIIILAPWKQAVEY